MRPYRNEKVSSPVADQWDETKFGLLTQVGRKMIVSLGQTLKDDLINKFHRDLRPEEVRWRASLNSSRGLGSGFDFVEGFNQSLDTPLLGPEPDNSGSGKEADLMFRAFSIVSEYIEDADERREEEEWITKADEEEEFLRRVYKKLGCGEIVNPLSPPELLFFATYMMSMSENEAYWGGVEEEDGEEKMEDEERFFIFHFQSNLVF